MGDTQLSISFPLPFLVHITQSVISMRNVLQDTHEYVCWAWFQEKLDASQEQRRDFWLVREAGIHDLGSPFQMQLLWNLTKHFLKTKHKKPCMDLSPGGCQASSEAHQDPHLGYLARALGDSREQSDGWKWLRHREQNQERANAEA